MMLTLNQLLTEHFRCPDSGIDFVSPGVDESQTGFFRLGEDVVCYGRTNAPRVARTVEEPLNDASADTQFEPGRCRLSFDAVDAIENLRRERYVSNGKSRANGGRPHGLSRSLYYSVRSLLPITIRRRLQRRVLAPRMKVCFPNWPVDRTADRLLENLLALSIKAQNRQQIPFIWFWPDGYSSAAIVTHDVETQSGLRFCSSLMDLDESFRIPSSFQIVPENRYSPPQSLLSEFRQRGFEINVHDLNHDGRLYSEHQEFMRRVKKINAYGREFRAKGFRSGALYRNLDWHAALDFSYDMSVPNVAHMEPQSGGCCTVMPFFVGQILELPVTTIQDYSLFHILGEYSIELWKRQIQLIKECHGLVSIICHPDYLQEDRAQETYTALLAHLAQLRTDTGLWIALPSEVNDWWRLRNHLELVHENGCWRIEGPGRERARIAYAHLAQDGVHFQFPTNKDLVEGRPEAVHSTVA
jgi:hypothetical protein